MATAASRWISVSKGPGNQAGADATHLWSYHCGEAETGGSLGQPAQVLIGSETNEKISHNKGHGLDSAIGTKVTFGLKLY